MNLVFGEVELQDLTAALHKYRVRYSTGELSPWMPALVSVAGTARHNHALSIGTQVSCLMGLYEGIVLGALNSTQKAATTDNDKVERTIHADGAVIEYNALTHQLNASLPAGATTHLTSSGGITFDGDLTVNGNATITENLQVGQNISAGSDITAGGDVVANGISLRSHVHGGVASGSSNTGAPQ